LVEHERAGLAVAFGAYSVQYLSLPTDAERFRFLADYKLTLHTNGEDYTAHYCRTLGPGQPPLYYPVANGRQRTLRA
jgi:hypothetical protein